MNMKDMLAMEIRSNIGPKLGLFFFEIRLSVNKSLPVELFFEPFKAQGLQLAINII